MLSSTFIERLQRITDLCGGDFDSSKRDDVVREVSALCCERLSQREVALVIGTLSCIAVKPSCGSRVPVIKQALRDILSAHLGDDILRDDRVSGIVVTKLLEAVSEEAQRVQNPCMYQMVLDVLHLGSISLSAAEQRLVWRAVGEECFASSASPATATSEQQAVLSDLGQLFLKREFFKDIFELVAPIEREYAGEQWRGIPLTKEFAGIWLSELDRQSPYPLPADLGVDHPEFAYLVRVLFERFCSASGREFVDHEWGASHTFSQQGHEDVCKPTAYLIRYFVNELEKYRAKYPENDGASESYCSLVMRLTYSRILKGAYACQIRKAEEALERLFKRVEAGELQTSEFQTERVADIPLADGRAIMEWSCPPESKEQQLPLNYPLCVELSKSELKMKLKLEMGLVRRSSIKAYAAAVIDGRRVDFGRFQVGSLNDALLGERITMPAGSAWLEAPGRGSSEIASGAVNSGAVPITPDEFGQLLNLFVQLDQAANYVQEHFPRAFAT